MMGRVSCWRRGVGGEARDQVDLGSRSNMEALGLFKIRRTRGEGEEELNPA
jgi:hypothetical protein